ncbi:hypothetical protein GOODEAATRI_004008 [Goodea atripinnis]|uniref:Uncharacterized protein n=1 Tax=Goodea atripinnis TaxID=208336 RepID=A0ABV0PV53_9TELE
MITDWEQQVMFLNRSSEATGWVVSFPVCSRYWRLKQRKCFCRNPEEDMSVKVPYHAQNPAATVKQLHVWDKNMIYYLWKKRREQPGAAAETLLLNSTMFWVHITD